MTVQLINARTCKNCKHASVQPPGAGLQCRAAPPTANAILAPDGRGGISLQGVVSVFPVVQPDMWCARFERGVIEAVQ